ncbi:hypothetical protein KEM52_003302 [Ascosphaera acerosa]|nr:hypothetical protein KEM52_003302 [Ascosphaera acerosa]
MEAAVASPRLSNNVTVEYTDPSGVFETIEPLLESILPLRNLHWKSPTRPLRSIDSLQVDFVPAETTHGTRGGDSVSSTPHRRHQIPGLRQTPYVKIYLLRCDDNDTYKNISRKLVREWVRSQSLSTQAHSRASVLSGGSSGGGSSSSSAGGGGGAGGASSGGASSSSGSGGGSSMSQDNHDACDWLIVHVASEGSDRAPSTTSALKWTGRASTSVLERVRADFNGSSKSAVDRVAQLRVPRGGWAQRRTPEQDAQIDDLVMKLKYAILTAFSSRINQYEEDIREKDAQRSLPGWNFCTFFMLKEGLVLGFEHVGLYDDALVGYDELAVGLDSTLRDQMADEHQHAGTFLEYSKEVASRLKEAVDSVDASGGSTDSPFGDSSSAPPQAQPRPRPPPKDGTGIPDCVYVEEHDYPFDVHKKPYRDMILANNISVFDFKVYIFSRQMTLLLKAAKAHPTRSNARSGAKSAPHTDLSLLAEICERASEFISYAARTLRHDLLTALPTLQQRSCSDTVAAEVVDNLVASWTYAAVSQVLTQTSSLLLDVSNSCLVHNGDKMAAAALSAFLADRPQPQPPRRSSSLSTTQTPATFASPQPAFGRRMSPSPARGNNSITRNGSIDLAATRGDLFDLARRVLDRIGRRRTWVRSWRDIDPLHLSAAEEQSDAFQSVSLNDDDDGASPPIESTPQANASESSPPTMHGLDTPILKEAAFSADAYHRIRDELTDQLFRLYFSAGRIRLASTALLDLARSKYRCGETTIAGNLFDYLAAFYGARGWRVLEGITLELCADCLYKTAQWEGYVQAMLRLVSSYVGDGLAQASSKSGNARRSSVLLRAQSADHDESRLARYITDLLQASARSETVVPAQLSQFFDQLTVHPAIVHLDNGEGTGIVISLRCRLGRQVQVKQVRLCLSDRSNASTKVWFECNKEVVVTSAPTQITVEAPVSMNCECLVERLEVRVENILFVKDFAPTTQAESNPPNQNPVVVALFSSASGLDARITAPRLINLSRLRTVDVQITAGQNDVQTGLLRVKPATAGLRLRVADASLTDGDVQLDVSTTGQIELKGLAAGAIARVSIPYTMELNQQSLSIKLELSYETKSGTFLFSTNASVLSLLPISVNVQDIFQDTVLISKFTVSPGLLTPIRLYDCHIESTPAYEVMPSLPPGSTLNVFPKQPASIVYKTFPRLDEQHGTSPDAGQPLALNITFSCLDEECLFRIKEKLQDDLANSEFRRFSRLLVPKLLQAFTQRWSAGDLEVIGLLREVTVLPFDVMRWPEYFESIGLTASGSLLDWLRQWHAANAVVQLDDTMPADQLRRITIPVDVPELQVVHTAVLELVVEDTTGPNAAEAGQTWGRPRRLCALVNEMIAAKLKIWHTRRWCHPSRREAAETLEFIYDLTSNSDVWVIGGRKRGVFTAADGECRTFDVLLLPQKTGHLLLPGLEIKSYVVRESDQRDEIPCELDYRSYAQSILVTPNFQSTTVLLDPAGSSNLSDGSWLVDSKRFLSAENPRLLPC